MFIGGLIIVVSEFLRNYEERNRRKIIDAELSHLQKKSRNTLSFNDGIGKVDYQKIIGNRVLFIFFCVLSKFKGLKFFCHY